ncbi:MAG: cytochrome c biogenesis protein ResB [Magnetococcales bacterium]|nr:cytochrome c biogenesis protein ResB [Magnetococcales bacterium]
MARLASLRLTLLALIVLGVAGVLLLRLDLPPTWVLALPCTLLVINLVAAIFWSAAFRQKWALQVFHLALLAILLLAVFSRLTYFKGQFELSAGERFAGQLLASEQGPWHPTALEQIDFINETVQVDFATGGVRGETRNWVRWFDAQKVGHLRLIGDNTPLLVRGYRIYPSRHFGYAPLFSWQPAQGHTSYRGTIHLPGLSLGATASNHWTIPGTTVAALVMLQLDKPVPDPAQPSLFARGAPHHLLVTLRGESRPLRPGEQWLLPEGTLLYEGLETWMGYVIFYDQGMPWLLAAALVGIISLLLHFFGRFASKPWHAAAQQSAPGLQEG